MDLRLTNQRFLICGASSGFGRAIAHALLREGASLIVVARRKQVLDDEFDSYGDRVESVTGSLTDPGTIDRIVETTEKETLHGLVINAGGPPTGTPLETTMEQWDDSWQLVMRWKIDLTLRLAPRLVKRGYGRILYIESKSVKEPIPLLTLSNSFRAGVVGFAKSLALELAPKGVTVNVLAPGAHDTPAIKRVIDKRSQMEGISKEEARRATESGIPVRRMGTAEEFASLASWILSPLSGYVTGQTISHDGGAISGLFG